MSETSAARDPAWLVGHISDLHLGDGTAAERAGAVLAELAALNRPLDLLVVTGDVSDAGQQADYQWLRPRLGGFARVVAVPGNHDDRDALRSRLLDGAGGPGPGARPVNTVHDLNGLVVLGCDSSVPGENAGLLSRHLRVRALLCGHIHQAVSGRFAGVPVVTAPSVAPGWHLPWQTDRVATQPGFAVHAVSQSGDLTSYFRSTEV